MWGRLDRGGPLNLALCLGCLLLALRCRWLLMRRMLEGGACLLRRRLDRGGPLCLALCFGCLLLALR